MTVDSTASLCHPCLLIFPPFCSCWVRWRLKTARKRQCRRAFFQVIFTLAFTAWILRINWHIWKKDLSFHEILLIAKHHPKASRQQGPDSWTLRLKRPKKYCPRECSSYHEESKEYKACALSLEECWTVEANGWLLVVANIGCLVWFVKQKAKKMIKSYQEFFHAYVNLFSTRTEL